MYWHILSAVKWASFTVFASCFAIAAWDGAWHNTINIPVAAIAAGSLLVMVLAGRAELKNPDLPDDS